MAINRREFLQFLTVAPAIALSDITVANTATRLVSCRSNSAGQHFCSIVDPYKGSIDWEVQLPSRGHGLTLNYSGTTAVVFARRPGDYFWVIDLLAHKVTRKVSCSVDRHFYGHGCFSRDGKTLYTSENDFESGDGRIGVYAVDSNYAKVDEFPSHGIGPHEIRVLNRSNILVVANGGIQTHPDMPRAKLNIDSMQPNLAYVDAASGALISSHKPPEKYHQLSIRHIDVSNQDQVAIAMQYEGAKQHRPPLIAIHKDQTKPLLMLKAPADIQKQMKNYCGSVEYSATNDAFAVSSPRGGLVTHWSANGDYLATHLQSEVCGLASNSSKFWSSDGDGLITQQGVAGAKANFSDIRWDNHMIVGDVS